MSKSGLFRHFGSKEELQLATVEEASRIFVAAVIEPALAAEEGGARLRALCDGYIGHLERQTFSGGCFWGATTAEFDDRPGPVRDAIGGASAPGRPSSRARLGGSPGSRIPSSSPSSWSRWPRARTRATGSSATPRRSRGPGPRSAGCSPRGRIARCPCRGARCPPSPPTRWPLPSPGRSGASAAARKR